MTSTRRIVHSAILIGIALVAGALHAELRDPTGEYGGVLRFVLLGMLLAGSAAVVGAPGPGREIVRNLTTALWTGANSLVAAATIALLFPGLWPRFAILVACGLATAWLAIAGTIGALRARRRATTERVLVVAEAAEADRLRVEGETTSGDGAFELVDEARPGDALDLVSRCADARVTTIVIGPSALLVDAVIDQASLAHERGVRVRSVEAFYDGHLGKLPLSSVDRFGLMNDIESLHGGYAPVKRALDLLVALAGAVVLVLVLPVVLLGNLVANRGPLLFRQERVGHFGRHFSILKFRTMRPDAADISGWTTNDDPRITGFGRVLRRTHIDELPQVWNVIRGDLSIVGPRPEQVGYVNQLRERIPFYDSRQLVLPGLTGWAQVRYPYAASEEDAAVKLQYDLHYIRHQSLQTDLRIMLLTVRSLLRVSGR